MIFSHRKAHFYAAIGLACTLPVVFGAGLVWRPTVPNADRTADPLFAAADFAAAADDDSRTTTLMANEISVRAAIVASPDGSSVLILQPERALEFADVLVYWTANDSLDSPDDRAILLGQLSGTARRQFPLPAELAAGYLFFYSQGQERAIASVPFP